MNVNDEIEPGQDSLEGRSDLDEDSNMTDTLSEEDSSLDEHLNLFNVHYVLSDQDSDVDEDLNSYDLYHILSEEESVVISLTNLHHSCQNTFE